MLAEHPDVCTRLRTEVLEKVGMRRPTYEDIRDMKYLRAFINGNRQNPLLIRRYLQLIQRRYGFIHLCTHTISV